MKIAILGRTEVLLNTIQSLYRHGHSIVLIGTCKASDASIVKEDHFAAYAKSHDIAFFNNVKLHDPDVFALLQNCGADIGISINWMSIVTSDVRSLFQYGVLNAHAGDLPRYRGNATPNWAILNGENEVAFCIHEMVDALDSGPIYARYSMPISDSTRIGEIYDWTNSTVPEAYARVVDAIERGGIKPVAQLSSSDLPLRCYPRLPSDSQIDWNDSARHLVRLVNASSEPFSGAYSYIGDMRITIWRAHAERFPCKSLAMPGQVLFVDSESGQVAVAAGDGMLVLDSISVGDTADRLLPAKHICSLRTRFHADGWISHTPCFR